MAMTPLPPAPSRGDPVNFAAKGDALMAALPGFVDEANALQIDVADKQQTASDAAATATTKAAEAGNSAGAASGSASTASAQASAASASAAAALNSQNAAATSATNAAGSATAAANSAASVDAQGFATDYAGPAEPAITWPYMTWADTGNGVLRRRNGANTVWWIERTLFEDVRLTGSAIDTTPGRALKTGDWGIGGSLPEIDGADLLADDNLFEYYVTNAVNTPAGVSAVGYVKKETRTSAQRKVTFTPADGRGPWVNVCNNGTWFGWSRLITDVDGATETFAGVLQIASTAIAQAMANDTMTLTPKKLADALKLRVGHIFTGNDWTLIAGGALIMQWGTTTTISAGGTNPVALPIAYTTVHAAVFALEVAAAASTNSADVAIGAKTLTGFNVLSRNSTGNSTVNWISFGV